MALTSCPADVTTIDEVVGWLTQASTHIEPPAPADRLPRRPWPPTRPRRPLTGPELDALIA